MANPPCFVTIIGGFADAKEVLSTSGTFGGGAGQWSNTSRRSHSVADMASGSFVSWRRDSDEISLVEGDHIERQIAQKQDEHLLPLKEDVAEWIGKTLDITGLCVDNFMESLETGVLLCRLARIIQEKADECRRAGIINQPFPSMKFKCWENAKPQSFYARDNMENFLRWCRRVGVNEAIIFESDGLVLHTQPRTVVLCLLEIGRIASRFGVEPPGLVKLEKEIEEEYGAESEETASNCSSRASSSPILLCRSRTESAMSYGSNGTSRTRIPSGGSSPRSSPRTGSSGSGTPPATSELDKKVMHVAKSVFEDTSRIKRISEGRYKIAGKTVYIRLLKGRHVMVRVGGGWDTLEHYLTRHEPCQVNVISRRQSFNEASVVGGGGGVGKVPLATRQSFPGPNQTNGRPVSASAIMSSLTNVMDGAKRGQTNGVHRRASSGALIGATTRGVSPDSYLQIRSKYRTKTADAVTLTNGKTTSNVGIYSSFRGTTSSGSKAPSLTRQMSSPLNGSAVNKTVRVSSAALNSAGNMRPSISRRPSNAQTNGHRKSHS